MKQYVGEINMDLEFIILNQGAFNTAEKIPYINRLCRYYNQVAENTEIDVELKKLNDAEFDFHMYYVYTQQLEQLCSNHFRVEPHSSSRSDEVIHNFSFSYTINHDYNNIDALIKCIEDVKNSIKKRNINLSMLENFIIQSAAESQVFDNV